MADYRILVTGSREWDDAETLIFRLAGAIGESGHPLEDVVVVHGDCPKGADAIAARFCADFGYRAEPHPADWNGYGKQAGYIRNAEMASLGADLCLAFYKQGAGNKGTDHCARQAESAGIPVRRITSAGRDVTATLRGETAP